LERLRAEKKPVTVTFWKKNGTLREMTGMLIQWTKDADGFYTNVLFAEDADDDDEEFTHLRTFKLHRLSQIVDSAGTAYDCR
jgi:hypothetical protein